MIYAVSGFLFVAISVMVATYMIAKFLEEDKF
jgi:hypothetical protein